MADSYLERVLMEMQLFDPKRLLSDNDKDQILEDDLLLEEVASISERALKALIAERLVPIFKEIVTEAHPASVMPLRQAIVEVGSIVDDYLRYVQEYKTRKEAKDKPAPTEDINIADTAPVGATTSL